MEGAVNLLRGSIRLEAQGARPQQLLNLLARSGISFWDAEPLDEYTIRLSVHRRSRAKLRALARRSMCELKVIKERGAPKLVAAVRRRYVLLTGLLFSLAALFASSLFIWDIRITGNSVTSDGEILCALEQAGVKIGSFWPSFVSDSIRSRALVNLPGLSWLTVNVSGSQAEVIVRERVERPEIVAENVPADVVAKKTGLIASIHAMRGLSVLFPGQAVAEGETIVTGIVNSGFAGLRFERAIARVRAQTFYELTAITPLVWSEKVYTGGSDSLLSADAAGKNIIFSLNYGISDSNCDKIIVKTPLAVEGVFTLPLSFTSARLEKYELREVKLSAQAENARLQKALLERLTAEIGSDGKILSHEFDASESDGILYVTLRALCEEDIAQTRELSEWEMNVAKAAEEENTE